MSCVSETSNHRQSAAIAVLCLTRHSSSVVMPHDCASTATADARTAFAWGSVKSSTELVGDSKHAIPECVWGDEGPIND